MDRNWKYEMAVKNNPTSIEADTRFRSESKHFQIGFDFFLTVYKTMADTSRAPRVTGPIKRGFDNFPAQK